MLSDDIWSVILASLIPPDLAATSKVSRGLHALTTPFLYRSIDWDWLAPPRKRILCLLRTILSRPELASCVREVHLVASANRKDSWSSPMTTDTWEFTRPKWNDAIDSAKQIVLRARLDPIDEWLDNLTSGNVYTFVSILISQLHNLRSLRLDYTFIWKGGFPGRMLHHALLDTDTPGVLSRFGRLETVDYGSNVPAPEELEDWSDEAVVTGYPSCRADQFRPWFYLPALHALEIWLNCPAGSTDSQASRAASNLSRLRRLSLVRAAAPGEDIRDILSHTMELRALHLGMAPKLIGNDGLEAVLVEGLNALPSSLEHLSIGVEHYPFFWGAQLSFLEPVLLRPLDGLLTRFPCLLSAEIPATMLMGWYENDNTSRPLEKVLPGTLQRLCLRDDLVYTWGYPFDPPELLQAVRNFSERWKEVTPLLERIVQRQWDDAMFNPDGADHRNTRDLCHNAGLELEVVYTDYPPGLWTTTTQTKGVTMWG